MAAHRPGTADPRRLALTRDPPRGSPAEARLRVRTRAAHSACEAARERDGGRERENWRRTQRHGGAAKDEYLAPHELPQCTAEWSTEGGCEFNLLKPQNRDDVTDLRKQLYLTRRLVSAVRSGRGYFALLQREQRDQQEALLQERRRTEEVQGADGSTGSSFDWESDEAQVSQQARSWSWTRVASKEMPAVRPFTPVHHSLTSLQHSSAALDPGRSRTTTKALNKEKEIEARWCEFVSQPKKTPHRIPPTFLRCSEHKMPSSSLSVASSCTATPALGSLSSLVPGPEEGQLPGGTTTGKKNPFLDPENDEDEQPVSNYLQKLLDEVYRSVAKEMEESDQGGEWPPESSLSPRPLQGKKENPTGVEITRLRPKSSPVTQPSATSLFIERKASMLKEMKAAFQQRSQEQTLDLRNTLESWARQRWESSMEKYQALCKGRCHRDSHHVSVGRSRAEAVDQPSRSSWLQTLLSRLPEAALGDQKLRRVLNKLARFADGRRLRAPPQVFLRVLDALPPWELCCPDLCAAIEIVRERVVQMTKEDYDIWLQSRVFLPYGAQSAPQI